MIAASSLVARNVGSTGWLWMTLMILLFCHHAYMKSYFSHVPISLLLFSSDCFRYIEYLIGRAAKPLPTRFGSLPNLCKEVLSEFSVMNLRRSSKGNEISSAP